AGPCPADGVCPGSGAVTFTFSQPVLDPILHIAAIGAWFAERNVPGQTHGQSWWTADRPVTLLSGPNLMQSGNTIRPIGTLASTDCATLDPASSTSLAGCGSVRIDGVVTSVTFDV